VLADVCWSGTDIALSCAQEDAVSTVRRIATAALAWSFHVEKVITPPLTLAW
jgi:hypothetical protein